MQSYCFRYSGDDRFKSTPKSSVFRQLVAVKRQHKQRETGLPLMVFLRSEMAVLKELHHENLVEWFHTIETTYDIYAVLEFCSGETLTDFIELKRQLVQVLSALLYLH